MLQPMLCANWWAIVQCDLEEDELNRNHETSLEKEGVAVVFAEPVEDSEASVSMCVRGCCAQVNHT